MTRLFKILFFVLMGLCLQSELSFGQDTYSGNPLVTEFKAINDQNKRIIQGVQNGSVSEAREMEQIQELLKRSKRFYSAPALRNGSPEIKYQIVFLIAELEHYQENLDSALSNYQLCIEIIQKNNLPDSLLFKSYLFSGIILYQQSRINDAASLFHKAEDLQLKTPQKLSESERLNNTLGVINYEIGNYRLAKNYFNRALEDLSKNNPFYKALRLNYNINLAQIYSKLEEYDKALEIYRSLMRSGVPSNDIYHNMGLIYLNINDGDSAVFYLKKVKYDDRNELRLFNNLARAYLLLNKSDSANYFLNLADSFRKSQDNLGIGMVMKTKGDFYKSHNDYQKAYAFYTAAIKKFYPSFIEQKINEPRQKFFGYFSCINLYEAVIARAELTGSRYFNGKNLDAGNKSLSDYQLAFHLIEYIENIYGSDEARLFINKMKYRDHGNAIDLAFSLYQSTNQKVYFDILFAIDQQNKSSVLTLKQIAVNDISSEKSEGSREKELRLYIRKVFLLSSQTSDSVQLAKYNKNIVAAEIEIENLHKNRLSEIQSYKTIPSVQQLQKNYLSEDAALISYHIFRNRLTTIIVTKDEYQAFQDTISNNFRLLIYQYLNNTKSPADKLRMDLSDYLFNTLLGRVDKMNVRRLVIIPDDELNYLPLESLRSAGGYLAVERFSILYQYSASLLKRDRRDFAGLNHLGMAPFNKSSGEGINAFIRLPYSEAEVKYIHGKKLTGKEATKTSFLKLAGKYSMLHLATHAVSKDGPGQSYIVFQGDGSRNDLLYAEEIYGMDLKNTRLIILSACETGTGQLLKGEGLMSISRSFSYAGCENIISTMWKSDDFATSYIIRRIYYYLNRKYPVDIALQQSKLDYLKDPSVNPRLKHPYYWSEIIYIGNFNPNDQRDLWVNTVVLVFSVFTSLLSVWFLYREFSKTRLMQHF
jgi:CHAT domain-containing protein/tetratricopeptide (TPR) repeat protein